VRRAERVLAGTGLFLGTGAALERAGPLSVFLAFTIVGMVFDSGAARTKDRPELTAAVCRDGRLRYGSELGRDRDLAAHQRWIDRVCLPLCRPGPRLRDGMELCVERGRGAVCRDLGSIGTSFGLCFHPIRIATDDFQVIIGYWDTTVHVGVWIAIILVVIIALNSFVVGGYGEAEFIFASTLSDRVRWMGTESN